MDEWLWCTTWFAAMLPVAAAMGQKVRGGGPPEAPATDEPAPPRPMVTVSKETTFLAEPLREDGTVDYVAALNRRLSQGVTPENNAAVLVLQAAGPAEIDVKLRRRFFERLGIASLPEKGSYLEPYGSYFARKSPEASPKANPHLGDREQAGWAQLDQVMGRPWTAAEFPLAAAWLDESRQAIDMAFAATERPRWYVPRVGECGKSETLITVDCLGLTIPSRGVVRALRARAMFRLGEGKVEKAWQDLLACHRLARLLGQGPMLVDALVAIALEGIAIHGDAVLAHEGRLTAEQARRFADDCRQLPPLGRLAEKIDGAERLWCLDGVQAAAKEGPSQLLTYPDGLGGNTSDWPRAADELARALVDWSEPMRMGNARYDRAAAALAEPTYQRRLAAVKDQQRDLKREYEEAKKMRAVLQDGLVAGSLRPAMSRMMGQLLVSNLLPPILAAACAEDCHTVRQEMTPVLFALAAYRADHGSYPAELAALVPEYLPDVPEDLFSGEPLRYRREEAGYLLYSVGPDGKDDGGRHFSDQPYSEANVECDDIAVRTPARRE
jgi:hypothetical protein